MYPKNAVSPPRIAIGAVVQISDGAVQSGVSIAVRAEGGAEAAGGGTVSYGASSGVVYYVPTQAETNYTAFVVTAYKAGCLPVSVTIVTTATSVAGTTSVGVIGAGVITAASIASGALAIAKFASDVGTTAYASNPIAQAVLGALTSATTGAGTIGKKIADMFQQTGDAFARLGAPTGASVSADIATKATAAELAKVAKKDTAQTWTNQAGDTQTVTITQA